MRVWVGAFFTSRRGSSQGIPPSFLITLKAGHNKAQSVHTFIETASSNPMQGKCGKCGRYLSPQKNKGLRRFHIAKTRKTQQMRAQTRKRGKCRNRGWLAGFNVTGLRWPPKLRIWMLPFPTQMITYKNDFEITIVYKHPVLTLYGYGKILTEGISLIFWREFPLKLRTLKVPTP